MEEKKKGKTQLCTFIVLFLLAAVVNAGVCMYQMKRSAKQHPQH